MKTLVIDTHGSEPTEDTTNVHARNSSIIAEYLGAELYMCGTNSIEKHPHDYDRVIFVHSSPYVQATPIVEHLLKRNAKYFYVTNEYNLGQAIPLWVLSVKHGHRYEVIANHAQEASKRLKVEKPISMWHRVNLNALIYNRQEKEPEDLFGVQRDGIVYFGTYRKGRMFYFDKYFQKGMTVSTSSKNVEAFKAEGLSECRYIDALRWHGKERRLGNFKSTIYIEDVHTHKHYNYLANRWYEALSFDTPMFFDVSCKKSAEQSGYPIEDFFFVDSFEELKKKTEELTDFAYPEKFHEIARKEKELVLESIKQIVWRKS